MGNVFFGAETLDKADAAIQVFEAADPAILQSQVQAAINALILGDTYDIADLALAGAGDGHAFVVTMLYGTASRSTVAGTEVRFYMAATKDALDLQIAAALADIGATDLIVGHAEAGAAQGHRWMGMIVSEPGLQ